VRTPSLFGEGKVVVIENAEAAEPAGAEPRAGKRKADAFESLASAVLATPPTGAVLVLSTPRGVKGKTSVGTEGLVGLGALVVDCRALYDAPGPWEHHARPWEHELGKWVVRRMRDVHGKALDLPEAHALVLRVGNDPAGLDDALRTLSLYLGVRPKVTGEDVAKTIGETREDPVWTLVDAVLDGDAARALDLSAAVFDRGLTDPRGTVVVRPDSLFHQLVGALHGQFRKRLLVAEALARGESDETAARAVALPPFKVAEFVERCRKDPASLLERHAAIFEAGVKGGGVPPRLAWERLVVRFVAAAEASATAVGGGA
jgi:DNA polymerase III delta subunit